MGLYANCACVTVAKISGVRKFIDNVVALSCVILLDSGEKEGDMSIILGPYDNRDNGGTATVNQHESPGEDELFVFGYACKLFRNDDKALLEDSGQLLIPWMGDGSLMIDRSVQSPLE